jgi:hypothetical protein
MEGKKTRTLEQRKGAAPKVQKYSKAGPPASALAPIHFPDSAFLASATAIIKIMGSTGETRNPCRS